MGDTYIRNLLEQTLDSYKILIELRDEPEDLITIKQEVGKIHGLVQVTINKIEKSGNNSDSVSEFLDAAQSYLRDYSFNHEIYTVLESYPEDSHRIKNIRLVIVKALERSGVIPKAEELLRLL